jgi:hypothetical protein
MCKSCIPIRKEGRNLTQPESRSLKSQITESECFLCHWCLSIESKLALRTLECLRTSKLVMNKSTISTCFRCVMFVTDDNSAPRKFSFLFVAIFAEIDSGSKLPSLSQICFSVPFSASESFQRKAIKLLYNWSRANGPFSCVYHQSGFWL